MPWLKKTSCQTNLNKAKTKKMCGSGNLTLPTILVPTLIFFCSVKKKIAVLLGTVGDAVQYSSVVPEQSLGSFWVDRMTAHLPLPVSLSIIRFFAFFPISVLKVMDSVSVLLNIFRPKCEHAVERTF